MNDLLHVGFEIYIEVRHCLEGKQLKLQKAPMEDLAMIRIYFLEMKIVINTMCNLSSAKKLEVQKQHL